MVKDTQTVRALNKGEGKNRFKFQSFSQRIAAINIDVVHKIGNVELEPGENGSFFRDAIEKWRELNCTSDFADFTYAVHKMTRSLPQILFHKTALVDLLVEHLKRPDSQALEPLLDLVAQLARDLRQDFYPLFPRIFDVIVLLIDPSDPELLEQVFTALSYLFKFLMKYLIKDLDGVFKHFVLLLSYEQRLHVQQFAAESFALVLRRAAITDRSAMNSFITLLSEMSDETYIDALLEATGMLFFNAMKGVGTGFHSRANILWRILLSLLGPNNDVLEAGGDQRYDRVLIILRRTVAIMLKHTNAVDSEFVWCSLITEFNSVISRIDSSVLKTSTLYNYASRLAVLADDWATHRKGILVNSAARAYAAIECSLALCVDSDNSAISTHLSRTLTLLASMLKVRTDNAKYLADGTIAVLFQLPLPTREVADFIRSVASEPLFSTLMLKPCLAYVEYIAKNDLNQGMHLLMDVLTSLNETESYPVSLTGTGGRLRIPIGLTKAMLQCVQDVVSSSHQDITLLPTTWAALMCLNHGDLGATATEVANVLVMCIEISTSSIEKVGNTEYLGRSWTAILATALSALAGVLKTYIPNRLVDHISVVLRVASHHGTASFSTDGSGASGILKGAARYVSALRDVQPTALKIAMLPPLIGALKENLACADGRVRLATLQFLSIFPPLPFVNRGGHVDQKSQVALTAKERQLERKKARKATTASIERNVRQSKNTLSETCFEVSEIASEDVLTDGGRPHCRLLEECFTAENTPANLATFRDRLMYLRRVDTTGTNSELPPVYVEIVTLFLIGQLHVAWKDLHKPVLEMLQHQAKAHRHDFWCIFIRQLHFASGDVKDATTICSADTRQVFIERFAESHGTTRYNSLLDLAQALLDYIDVSGSTPVDRNALFLQLWKTMELDSDGAERMSRHIVPVFLDFIRDHYNPQFDGIVDQDLTITDPLLSIRRDFKSCNSSNGVEEIDIEEGENFDGDKEDEVEDTLLFGRKIANERLCACMRVMALFRDPKSLYRAEDLKKLYVELLAKGKPVIQELAVRCLLTWREPELVAYESILLRIAKEEQYRDELAKLDLSAGSGVIRDDHRSSVLDIILRLLFGKLSIRRGASSAKARRRAILSVLIILGPDETRGFFDLLLKPFIPLLGIDGKTVDACSTSTAKAVIPLRVQVGFLNTISDALIKSVRAIGSELDRIMAVVVRLACDAERFLSATADSPFVVARTYRSSLRSIRQITSRLLCDFFSHFPSRLAPGNVGTDSIVANHAVLAINTVVRPRLGLLRTESLAKPTTALTYCRIWSAHQPLWPYLVDTHALPASFSLLSVVGVSLSSVNAVLDIVECLLGSAPDSVNVKCQNTEELPFVLQPHVETLLIHLQDLMLHSLDMSADAGSPFSFSKRALRILSRLGAHVTDSARSTRLVALLLPFLKKGGRGGVTDKLKIDVLVLVRDALPVIDDPIKHYNFVCSMFSSITSRPARILLCELVTAISKREKSLAVVAHLVASLNAYDSRAVDEPDFEVRLCAFGRVIDEMLAVPKKDLSELKSPLSFRLLLPLAHNFVFFLRESNDLSLRSNSSQGLLKLIDYIHASRDSLLYTLLISNIIKPAILTAMRIASRPVRQEFLNVLGHMVHVFGEDVNGIGGTEFAPLQCLEGEDEESNFFDNIRHIQIHRRTRALRRLGDLAPQLTQGSVVKIFLPLVQRVVLEHSERAQDYNLVDEAIQAMGRLAGILPWSRYVHIIHTLLCSLTKQPQHRKPVMRCVVSILDNFAFELTGAVPSTVVAPDGNEEEESSVVTTEDPEHLNVQDEEDPSDPCITEPSDTVGLLPQRIHDSILNSLLPELYAHLKQKNGKREGNGAAETSLHVPLALAMVQLLHRLPLDTFEAHLPRLLTRIAVVLRSRDWDVREPARSTLCKISVLLGPRYLPFTVRELASALQRGYQRHVLGFTIHAILNAMSESSLKCGSLDDCVDDIAPILISDVFGEVAAEKEVSELASKMREVKATRGNDSFELFARMLSLSVGIPRLLPYLREAMEMAPSSKQTRHLREIFRRIGLGMTAAEDAPITSLMILIHGFITERLAISQRPEAAAVAEEESLQARQRKLSQMEQTYLVLPDAKTIRSLHDSNTSHAWDTNAHLLIEFGLSVLAVLLKRHRIRGSEAEHVKLLDPIAPVLIEASRSKHTVVMLSALKSLCVLLRMPLPCLENDGVASAAADRAFKLIKRAGTGDTGSELIQTCFKVLTAIVRDCRFHCISDDQLRALIQYCSADLENHDRHVTTLTMVRAIFSRKLVISEIYDLASGISRVMVSSGSGNVRDMCANTIAQFLLDYPLGQKRLRRHLSFFVENINYPYESGRIAVLGMLNSVISKFPSKIVASHAEFFFVPLVMSLVNDESSKCRMLADTVIKTLLIHVDVAMRDQMFSLVSAWSRPNQLPAIRRAAVQVAGIYADAEAATIGRRLSDILGVLDISLRSDDDQENENELVCFDAAFRNDDNWEIRYYALLALGKLLQIRVHSSMPLDIAGAPGSSSARLLSYMCGYLTHPHAWVRKMSSRTLGLFFSAAAEGVASKSPSPLRADSSAAAFLLESADRLPRLARSLCMQLETEDLDDELGDQVVKNLYFLSRVVLAHPPHRFPGEVDDEDKNDSDDSDRGKDIDNENVKFRLNRCLRWIFRRLSFHSRVLDVAGPQRRIAIQRRTLAFKFFAAMVSYLGPDDLPLYLRYIVTPVYQVLEARDEAERKNVLEKQHKKRKASASADNIEDTKSHRVNDRLKALQDFAQELLDMCQSVVGTTVFFHHYNNVRQHLVEIRAERKRKRTFEAVLDPATAAQRKIRKNLAKTASQKRKIESLRGPHKIKRARQFE